MDEILGAFEEALELERELGTRTVECDRALLLPPRAPTPVATKDPPPAPPRESSASTPPTPPVPSIPHAPTPPRPHAPTPSIVDFAFIAVQRPEGAAADLLAKMVAAMGYTMSSVVVTTAAEAAQTKPTARVQIVLGSDAFQKFAPNQRAALGLWTTVFDVPTVVTYSPARILSYFRNDQNGLRKAKTQIWNDLKSALARIGKNPPAARR